MRLTEYSQEDQKILKGTLKRTLELETDYTEQEWKCSICKTWNSEYRSSCRQDSCNGRKLYHTEEMR